MTAFLNKFFVDKFFILYFYISSSATYDFYMTIFLNLIAVLYFFIMLYALNFIAFLRNNFFNDLRIARFINYSLGFSTNYEPEKLKRVMETLAFYGYMVLTAVEVVIKSSFLVFISYFIVKAPFISLDPSPGSSWKFAGLFSKSRFYSYRPWTSTSNHMYRGFDSGNFHSEGAWIADDNDVVEAVYPRFLPRSKDFDHEDIFLRPGGVGLRLKTRGFAMQRFNLIGRQSVNWAQHLLGSKQDRMNSKTRVSSPRHRLEMNKIYFFRFKSLELKPSIHEPFSYYRSEDDCYPVSVKKGFLSRLYIPGFGSKARKVLIYMPSEVERDNVIFNGREMSATGANRGMNNHIEVQPYERFLIRESKANNTKYDPTADIYKEFREQDFEKASDTLQNNWLDYIERIKFLGIKNPTNYLSAKRFSNAYSDLNGLVTKYGSSAGGYELFNKESAILAKEESTLLKYFRYLTNDPSSAEQVSVNGRYNLFLNRNTPFRNVDVRGESSSLYTYSFDNKFSFIHNLRGKHVYRRSLFDFATAHVLEYSRSFSNFIRFNAEPKHVISDNPSFGTNASEELFGFMINDRKKFYKKVFKYGIVDEDNRPLQLRGRESFDLNYATAGSAFRYFFDDCALPKIKDRTPQNSFVSGDIDKRNSESVFFSKAVFDRKKVNTGVYIYTKLHSGEQSSDRKKFYEVGNTSFLNPYFRMVYQFALDHFTYWLRITFSYMNRNASIPHFPSPASDVADKPIGLNPYVIFFKTLYFFRKCFRVVLFGAISTTKPSAAKFSYGGGVANPYTLNETSDFTLLALKKTLFSYFARFLSLTSILLLNTALGGLNTALNFALNHITASIFLFFLGIVSLLRVKYPYEFDFSKVLLRVNRGSFKAPLSRFFIRVLQVAKAPFNIVVKSIDVLVRFFTTGNLNPSRKPRESAELYYERLVKEQQSTVNILSFFKVDKIRRFLNRLGFLRSRNSADFKGYDKSIFKIFLESFYKRQFTYYKKTFLSRRRLDLTTIWKRLYALNQGVSPAAYKRFNMLALRRYRLPYIDVKVKEKLFSFEPTEEFLRIKNTFKGVLNTIKVSFFKTKGFVNRGQALIKQPTNRLVGKKIKNNFQKLTKFFIRVSDNGINFIKWKITEWINR